MTKNFASSYPPLGGITGYSSNHGVWSRLHSQQSSSPRKKKRKNWYQSLGSKPVIYQISEREEEEDQALPLTTPDSVFSRTNSTLTSLSNSAANGDVNKELKNAAISPVIVQEVEMCDNSMSRVDSIHHVHDIMKRHSSETLDVPVVKQEAKSFYPFNNDMAYSKQKPHSSLEKIETLQVPAVIQSVKSFYPTNEILEHNADKLDDSLEKLNNKSSLQIPITDNKSSRSCYPSISVIDCDSSRLGNNSEHINARETLQLPETDQNTKSFYPPIAQTNLPAVQLPPSHNSSRINVTSRETGVKGVINPPKYTHIRVPKIHNRQSQFEVSKDSPFYIPSLSDNSKFHLPKIETKVRKPVKVSLSKHVEQAKSLNKPRKHWNFHSLDDPINYFETDMTQSVGTNEDNSNPGEHETGNNFDKLANYKHAVCAIDKRLNNSVIKNTLEDDIKVRKLNLKTQTSVSPRKKWDYPDFWPQEGNLFTVLNYTSVHNTGIGPKSTIMI